MPLKINSNCLNCGVCEILCPYNAIYPGGVNWRKIKSKYFAFCDDKLTYDDFWNPTHYYIVPDKCTECVGIFPVPVCKTACSKNAVEFDSNHWESIEHLYSKKQYLETLSGRF
jgi:ferredoxin